MPLSLNLLHECTFSNTFWTIYMHSHGFELYFSEHIFVWKCIFEQLNFVWDYFNWSLYEIKIIFEWCYLYPYKVMLCEKIRIYLYHLHNFPNESFLKGQKKIYTPRTHWPLLNSLLGARCNKYLFSKKNLKSIILFWVTSLSKSTK